MSREHNTRHKVSSEHRLMDILTFTFMIYWLQEATEAGAQPSATLTGAIVGAVVGLVGVLIGQYLQQLRHSQTLERTERRHIQTLKQTADAHDQTARIHSETLRHTAGLESQRAHEAALQNYFEQVGTLLIERPLHDTLPEDNLSTVVRAQTLAVLEGLDPDRKR